MASLIRTLSNESLRMAAKGGSSLTQLNYVERKAKNKTDLPNRKQERSAFYTTEAEFSLNISVCELGDH